MMSSQHRKGKQVDVGGPSISDIERDASPAAVLESSVLHPRIELSSRSPAAPSNTWALSLALLFSLFLSAYLVFLVPYSCSAGRGGMLSPDRPTSPGDHRKHQQSRFAFGTYNIRFSPSKGLWPPSRPDDQSWGEQPWRIRLPRIVDDVIWNELDVVGFQEVLHHQLLDLDDALGGVYEYRGVGRDDGRTAGEAVPIFWRRDTFDFVSVKHSWLSKTPDVPGSKDWDAGQTRMVTIVHLRAKQTKEDVWALNTHWDDKGVESRTKAAELIVSMANELDTQKSRDPLIVLLGDLNSPPKEQGYQTLTGHRYEKSLFKKFSTNSTSTDNSFVDSRHELVIARSTAARGNDELLLSSPYGQHDTFTGFSPNDTPAVIDVVLVHSSSHEQSWQIDRFGVLPNLVSGPKGAYLTSDHRLVVARLSKRQA